ncbi:MAG: hypothetical protein JWM05_856 [Acidimicrobiales bacterium]|nr:hypothetical protein [Acidimicrobiales bacterium]
MAVGAGFGTELPTMEVASKHVFEVNEQIQGDLRSLLQRLEPLFGNWQGTAATSFHVLKDRWHADATTLNDVLRTIAEGLTANTTAYASAEDTNHTGFTGMAGALS